MNAWTSVFVVSTVKSKLCIGCNAKNFKKCQFWSTKLTNLCGQLLLIFDSWPSTRVQNFGRSRVAIHCDLRMSSTFRLSLNGICCLFWSCHRKWTTMATLLCFARSRRLFVGFSHYAKLASRDKLRTDFSFRCTNCFKLRNTRTYILNKVNKNAYPVCLKTIYRTVKNLIFTSIEVQTTSWGYDWTVQDN